MSGIWRNLLTIALALFRYGRAAPGSATRAVFFITPLDTGLLTLKSDKYFQIAEAAQLDYLLKTGLMGTLLSRRASFVNVSQLVRFAQPVRLFDKVVVVTRVAHADAKCGWFSHTFEVGGRMHGTVLVKMKFKHGRLTLPADGLLGAFGGMPEALQRWDATLASLQEGTA